MTRHSPYVSPSLQSLTSYAPQVQVASTQVRSRRIWEEQERAEREKAKKKLPYLLLLFVTTIVEPLFIPGEPFDVYMRKVAVFCHTLMTSSTPFVGTWISVQASLDQYGWNSKRIAILYVCAQVSMHHIFFNYSYIRRTKTCPLWLADLSVLGAEVAILVMILFILPIDCRAISLCGMLLVTLMGSKLFAVHAVIHAALFMLHHFRSLWKDTIPQVIFSWDADEYTIMEKLVYTFASSILPPAMAVLGLSIIVTGYIRRSKEAQLTNVMTITIADLLQRYDTTAVSSTLEEYAGEVNERLLQAFDALRGNLDSFRPHIPRYLIDAAIERAEELDTTELAIQDALSNPQNNNNDEMSEGSISATISEAAMSHSAQFSGCPSPKRRASLSSIKQQHPGIQTKDGFTGNITSVYISLLDEETAAPPLNELNQVIEELCQLAVSTSASVHHLEDNGVMYITWNATKRTANHEIRACTFALKALDVLQQSAGFRDVAGLAIMGCPGKASFVGRSQLHFLLTHEEKKRHRFLLESAQRHKTVVCSPSVARNADMQFVFAGFGVDSRGRMMYELTQAREAVNEDEWMYALQSPTTADGNPYSKLTTAAARIFFSDNVEASRQPGVSNDDDDWEGSPLDLLKSLPESVTERSTTQELLALALK